MGLHRPYIRKEVRAEVERRAEKNDKGQFLDANTHEPIEGQYDLGHVSGHEHWREVEQAEKEGLTQQEFNERMNNRIIFRLKTLTKTVPMPMKCQQRKRRATNRLRKTGKRCKDLEGLA